MAEKKFFVDINLQGNALTNAKVGTNSAIGSTEGAFGYDSASHRLQYFDGTATKNVANLTDIATVTGGLIFQGGYDPTTNTPDITDGAALKGFFWVATAAGTFLGEAVQVGDSIVAKVDNAGATIADWLILQGNVVIATDSVDGISRLATQTEANDGTEAGAVVITPATLQGKIDAQITPEISSKLPLAGGTMSGSIAMDGNFITGVHTIEADRLTSTGGGIAIKLNVNLDAESTQSIINLPAPTNDGDATNKTYVDDQDALKLSLTGGTMSGDINMDNNGIENVNTLLLSNFGAIQVTEVGNLSLSDNKITDLAAPTDGGDAANKTYVDNADALKLDLAGGTMSGNIDMGMNEVNNLNAVRTDEVSNHAGTAGFTWDGGNLNLGGLSKITGLTGTPTLGTDATNKTYVDGVGATAESNANAYTDTEIAAQKFTGTIYIEDWIADGNFYYAVINHNLGEDYVLVQTYQFNYMVEFEVIVGLPGTIELTSNILPSGPVNYRISK